jgi:hypothetical protein
MEGQMPKSDNQRVMPVWLISMLVGAATISTIAAYLALRRQPLSPAAPPALVISVCRDPAPRMHRVRMVISDQIYFEQDLQSVWPVFSEHFEERDVRDAYGRVAGSDRWGYWKNGEDKWGNLTSGKRWRLIKFAGGEEVGYLPTSPQEALLFDQIINSACLLPVPGR